MLKSSFKRDRSLMQNTWGLKKSPFNVRKYKPGENLKVKNKSGTFYGVLLLKTQRLRAFYSNIKKKQLINLLKKAINKNNYKSYIISKLELRIDTILFRAGVVVSFGTARQLISYCHVYVNNICVKSCSYIISNGDKITFSTKIQPLITNSLEQGYRNSPNHIFIDKKNISMVINTDNFSANEKDIYTTFYMDIDSVLQCYKL